MGGSSTHLCSPLSWSLSLATSAHPPTMWLSSEAAVGKPAWSPGWVGVTEGPKKVCRGWAGCAVLTSGSGWVRQRGSLHKDGS